MRENHGPTTLGELVEAVTRAAEDDVDTASEAFDMAERALVAALVHAGRADVIEQLQELAVELEDEPARPNRSDGTGAVVAA